RSWAERMRLPIAGGPQYLAVDGWDLQLPNPFALLTDPTFADLKVDLAFFGHAHGDLNARNVLVPIAPRVHADEYRLLDLDNYSDQGPLSRDPMHLLVSLAIGWLPELSTDSRTRRALIEVLVDPDERSAPIAVSGYHRISAAIHDAAASWATSRGFLQEWTNQSLLSLVACGLMYAGRGQGGQNTDANRLWSFHLAAAAAQAYLQRVDRYDPLATPPPPELQHTDIPPSDNVVPIRRGAEPNPPTIAPNEELLQRLSEKLAQFITEVAAISADMTAAEIRVLCVEAQASVGELGGILDEFDAAAPLLKAAPLNAQLEHTTLRRAARLDLTLASDVLSDVR